MSSTAALGEIRPELNHLELRPMSEQQTLIYNGKSAFEVAAPLSRLLPILNRCDGAIGLEEICRGDPNPAEMRSVIETLWQEELEQSSRPLFPMEHLVLLGDQSLLDLALPLASPLAAVTSVNSREELADALARQTTVNPVVVILGTYLDTEFLTTVNQLCAEAEVPWAQFHLDLGKGWLGPLVIPGRTADYVDLIGRRKCAGDHIEAALLDPPISVANGAPSAPRVPGPSILAWMLGIFFAELEHAAKGGVCRLLSTEMEVDPDHRQVTTHAFLPLPDRAGKELLSSAKDGYHLLVDKRAGVILSQHRADHHPTIPSGLITVRSHCADLSRLYDWRNDLFVGGSNFHDEPAARGASLGEALERYCGNCLLNIHPFKATYNALIDAGEHAVDPNDLILHSNTMLEQPGCPFIPFTRETSVYWVKGFSITKDQPAWLPLSMVYANWYRGAYAEEPLTHGLYTPGMAAGEGLERALVGAVREVVERDITMAWWLNAATLPAVEITPDLDRLWDGLPKEAGQNFRLIHLDNPFGIPVMVGVVENPREGWLNIGFGCRPDPVEAAKKAWTEALTLQEGSRDLAHPESTLRKSTDEWDLLRTRYKPWRADRRYLDEFRRDFRDINDLMLQQQVFLDPRAIEKVRHLVDPATTRRFDDLPHLPDDRFETYQKLIEAKGFEIFYADITSPDIALTPYRVVRVMIPGLIPNMPAAFPAVGGHRVFALPVEMGWRDEPLTEANLHYFPMPHA